MPTLDHDFYRGWYPDVAGLDDAAIEAHWAAQPEVHKRFGSFAEMLDTIGLKETGIPADFDWEYYIKSNEDLPAQWNQWQARLHYLQYGHKEVREYRRPEQADSPASVPPFDAATQSEGADSQPVAAPMADFESATTEDTFDAAAQEAAAASSSKPALGKASLARAPKQPQYSEAQVTEIRITTALDSQWYASVHGLAGPEAATDHYRSIGRKNLLAPNREFSPLSYWQLNADVAQLLVDPVTHYIEHGYGEKRRFQAPAAAAERRRRVYSPLALAAARELFKFDRNSYLTHRPDLDPSAIDVWKHYQLFGELEGARPNPYFDGLYYRRSYAAHLAGWKLSALEHFLSIGMLSGLFPSAEVAMGAKRHTLHSAIEWAGHWLERDDMGPLVAPSGAHQPSSYTVQPDSGMNQAAQVGRKVLNWVIPSFSKGGGGHTTIFRCARTLSRLGWESTFWVDGTTDAGQIDALYAEYVGYFPSTAVSFRMLDAGFEAIEDEFLVATAWTTAYTVARNKQANVRLYFVQDRESLFSAAGTDALRAEYTYKMGFDFICAGGWLENLVADKGGDHTHFELCAEPFYQRKDPTLEQRDILAAVYVRGHTSRRCSDLMIEAANRLAKAGQGEIVIFGDDNPGPDVDPAVTNAGILTPHQMADLFHRAKFGLVASATNYSILPVEMAASGLVVIQPASDSTQDTTDAHGAISVMPTAKSIANHVLQLAATLDQASFDQLRNAYTNFARSVSWEAEFERVGAWLEKKVKPSAPAISLRKPATVVIPTYYPDEDFLAVLDAIHGQLCSYDVTIQIVDSRKNGQVSPVIEKIEQQKLASVHAIDAATFQHGETRNLGASLTHADFYAYLTQDALPASEYWLESLLTPLRMLPDCSYSFGPHRAYPQHHPIYDHELIMHFNGFVQHGFITNRRQHAGRYNTDPFFKAGLCFNSDNNAGYRGDLLRRFKFPTVDFAEDQGIAKRLLEAGFSRAYCPSAIIFHSHDYTSNFEEAYRRGVEEGKALFQNFGLIRFRSAIDVINSNRHIEKMVLADSVTLGLNKSDLKNILQAKISYIEGVWAASKQLLAEEDGTDSH
ncbi:mycofactocin system glycosyltransferase [Bordetella ansorpii]|uniref:Mycofactocin system glycosyltransferase n=1 Tax=Bordetella ansorpii TaxID=288768 RepID=A0A157M9N1_9BORD|nr:hypothetical protein [Bordetella ansorpii]SAI05698.1 mycofactocin system glycosyltransferase [Bordetella ansorpii]